MTDIAAKPDQEKETPLADRLQETAAMALSRLETWKKDLKDEPATEKLLEAVHELRKVCSRIEIDIALNDRIRTNAKRIPIPEHKSKMEKRSDQKPLSEILPVAEIKSANAKKRIEIESAHGDDDSDEDQISAENQSDSQDVQPAKTRRPRRRKKEDTNS